MGDIVELNSTEGQVLYRANSSAIRIRVSFPLSAEPHITFYSKFPPHQELYQLYIGDVFKLVDILEGNVVDYYNKDPPTSFIEFKDFWISWHSGKFQYGLCPNIEPMRCIKLQNAKKIGFVSFHIPTMIDEAEVRWVIERPPIFLNSLHRKSDKEIEGGELRWVKMTNNSSLPMDAIVGGYENEPLYIARAIHFNSLTPGKYLRTTNKMFVPWGHTAYRKYDFEILCGFNYEWVKTSDNYIPENAVVGGYSEVRYEPLYIGRAMVKNFLLVGKVHVLYNTCYVPFDNMEIEVGSYEILVEKKVRRGLFHDENNIVISKEQ